MATVKYVLYGNIKKKRKINLQFANGRKLRLSKNTGLEINDSEWSIKTNLPKKGDEKRKILSYKLEKLSSYIRNQFVEDNTTKVTINSEWLQYHIDLHLGRIEPEIDTKDKEPLLTYYQSYIDKLPYKVTKKGQPFKKRTIQAYQSNFRLISRFEKHRKKTILLKDIDLNFRDELIEYLMKVEKMQLSTLGRAITRVKTICLDAEPKGYKINPLIKHKDWIGFAPKTDFITLSFDEIEQIKNTSMVGSLENAKDWLIISCFIGQRFADLIQLTTKNIQTIGSYQFIVLTQQKTGKLVQIPIHNEVQAILDKRNGEFPPTPTTNIESYNVIYNRHIKQVAKLTGLNEVIKATKRATDRTEFEKWELVSSHIGRRSFATNFYSTEKYPTPILMNITGHTTENMFLKYIGKEPLEYSMQLAKIWAAPNDITATTSTPITKAK